MRPGSSPGPRPEQDFLGALTSWLSTHKAASPPDSLWSRSSLPHVGSKKPFTVWFGYRGHTCQPLGEFVWVTCLVCLHVTDRSLQPLILEGGRNAVHRSHARIRPCYCHPRSSPQHGSALTGPCPHCPGTNVIKILILLLFPPRYKFYT